MREERRKKETLDTSFDDKGVGIQSSINQDKLFALPRRLST